MVFLSEVREEGIAGEASDCETLIVAEGVTSGRLPTEAHCCVRGTWM